MEVEWREYALSTQKFKRKTVGFGDYSKKNREFKDEVFLRELSLAAGGIGCALWDAAIIFSRFVPLFSRVIC